MEKKDFEREIDRVEESSHSFIRYFGIFWGAILIFIIQNYTENGIAWTIGTQVVQFFANPLSTVNILGYMLLFLGVVYTLVSLIILIINAVTITAIQPANKRQEYLKERKVILIKSVRLAVVGTIILFLLFLLALMIPHELLGDDAQLLGQLFFWTIFLAIFLVDPVYLLYERKFKGVLAWLNLLIGVFITVVFIFSKFFTLTECLALTFLGVFVIYLLVRLIISLWIIPFFFSRLFSMLIPDVFSKS